ncbi:MAG TPA: hypothetical protein VF097_09025 [Actinomycetota bacterium]
MRRELDEIADAAGAEPRTGLDPRRPSPDDVVIVPEGWERPLAYGRVALSPARAVLLLLAPPGLFGWSFEESWAPPDPLTVAIEDVARPESFRAMHAFGFALWTHSPGIVKAAERAGVPTSFVGEGRPGPFPEVPPKRTDAVYLEDNRWADLARDVARELGDRVRGIPTLPHDEVLRRIGEARVLVLPSRVEGTSRIQWEARAMGTVPVALSTNPFAHGLDSSGGAVAVASVSEMAGAVLELLGDRDRLAELAALATRTARAQVDWEAFRGRVRDALDESPEESGRGARAAVGREIEEVLRRADARASEAEAETSRRARELERLSGRRSVRAAVTLADALCRLLARLPWRGRPEAPRR